MARSDDFRPYLDRILPFCSLVRWRQRTYRALGSTGGGNMPRNRLIAIVTAVVVIIIIFTVILLNRDDDDSTKTATVNQSQTQSDTESQTQSDTASSGTETTKVTLVSAATCHDKKLAGGNSDVLVELSVTGLAEGTTVNLNAITNKQSGIFGDGLVKSGKVLIRLPVVAIGEKLSLLGVSTPDGYVADDALSGFADPFHTVPDKPGDCELDAPETAANGKINQPNAANKANATSPN